jgi:beta-hydroxylase
LAVFVNLLFVFFVLKDIFISKQLYQKYSEILTVLAKKYEKKSIDRALLSLNLANNKVKGNPLPSHNGFSFVGLTSLPWHDPKNFFWTNDLEINYEDIKEEALNLMGTKQDLKPHYLNHSGIVKGQWNSIMLIDGGKKQSVCVHCPKTMKLLKLASDEFLFREVMFSILEPGAIIKPHRDYSNTCLTYHLGLLIPPESGIIVGGIERKWEEGKSVILDTSYEHEAWNYSDKIRLILLVDFFHPDLTVAEQNFLTLA